jgi:hypothetical protein
MVRDITTTYRMEHRRKEYQKIAAGTGTKSRALKALKLQLQKLN